MKTLLASKKKFTAELIGTFSLALLLSLTLTSGVPEAAPFVAAITLTILVYTIGGISGSHVNPAVTVGLWSIKKISTADAIGYILSQIVGAYLAVMSASLLVGGMPNLYVENALIVGVAELVGAAFLIFGFSAVVLKKTSQSASGITIGGSLLLGILIASTVGNGILNPAIALSVGSISVAYIAGPLVGGILSAQLYAWLAK
ncbi:hypothetical protein HN512_01685 [Candidatus Peregrinibacteria bacterium]|jgi:aquaporin Z|nr:hypothetical protein [Candidatus Peregrinibacteria bacterium]MBT3598525.1 hypothetical protein [Candidatus Peregrinibacteria bacterium]MBT4586079.1 hypothetical protein [Candidatus Peregrinibacteria bacterium]MBT6730347.1 hypothetical protein [Candidatus Peregrinibacteria bacterium]MBT7009023.1 hypothetical protein [Candidatus Peregrinibacteria bacterium]